MTLKDDSWLRSTVRLAADAAVETGYITREGSSEINREVQRLIKERNALFAACEKLVKAWDSYDIHRVHDAVEMARAAIAKAKPERTES